MMINLYRKSIHSFMSFADTLSPKSSAAVTTAVDQRHHHQLLGLGLISDHDHNNNNNNVIHQNQIIKSPKIHQSSSLTKDSGGADFIDDVSGGGGVVDGLMSCTESLGFESSNERLIATPEDCGNSGSGCAVRAAVRRRRVVERKFPPPLTSLNQHGQPNFYLRPVRKDGRLELTEVRIERTEILRACREDGRLRLHLIKDDEEEGGHSDNIIIEEEEEGNEFEDEEIIEDFVVNKDNMEFRRCVEVVNHHHRRDHHRRHNHHHHQHLDVWRQHCVTTS